MNKATKIIILACIIILIILVIIFFPKQKCGTWVTTGPAEIKCSCLGIKQDSFTLGGGAVFCKGVCLESTCKEVANPNRMISPVKADMNHLLDLESKEIKINRGGKMRFIVSAYNDGRFEDNPVGLFFQQCISESGENTTSISLVSPLQSFAVGTDAGWAAIILVNQTTKSGKYLCELRASDGNDFLLDGLVVEVI